MADEERYASEGDPACWLERVCEACGALVEAPLPAQCWRCGAQVAVH